MNRCYLVFFLWSCNSCGPVVQLVDKAHPSTILHLNNRILSVYSSNHDVHLTYTSRVAFFPLNKALGAGTDSCYTGSNFVFKSGNRTVYGLSVRCGCWSQRGSVCKILAGKHSSLVSFWTNCSRNSFIP